MMDAERTGKEKKISDKLDFARAEIAAKAQKRKSAGGGEFARLGQKLLAAIAMAITNFLLYLWSRRTRQPINTG
jgi:hypothetical protein